MILVGDERGFPFGRPPLSKTYLRGEESLDGWLVAPPAWYGDHDVECPYSRVASIDTSARRVALSTGESIEYTQLLIATGGRNRKPDVAGADLPGVHQLRTVAESDAIRNDARRGAKAVVVGMGFIGCEVSASLRKLGVEVTAVYPGGTPLESVLGAEMGALMASVHREEGVELLPRDAVVRFEGAGKVERAVTRGGRVIECDLAVIAVGIQPNVEVLQGTPVAVDNGVLVDGTLRTNVPEIFAAGDVANHAHPLFGRVRVEHYNNGEKQGRAVARSMLRPGQTYDYLHTFWSDQYAHKIEYAGHALRWDEFAVRGNLDDRKLVGFYLANGVVRAVVGFDRGGDPELEPESEMAKGARLVARAAHVAPEDLRDEQKDLATL